MSNNKFTSQLFNTQQFIQERLIDWQEAELIYQSEFL